MDNLSSAQGEFVVAATAQAASIEIGDYKKANALHKKIEKIVGVLKESGKLHELRDLLKHNSIGVRLWAAPYLLSLYEDEAISTLQEITKQPGIHSLTAETILSEWQKGNLK